MSCADESRRNIYPQWHKLIRYLLCIKLDLLSHILAYISQIKINPGQILLVYGSQSSLSYDVYEKRVIHVALESICS